MALRGMLTLEELRRAVQHDEIDTVVVGFSDNYGRIHGKRFDAEFFLEQGHAGGTHACDYLLTVDMEMDPVPGYDYANWESGYGDFHMAPDQGTLRIASWLDRTAIVLCDVHDPKTHDLVDVAPRSMLRNQLDALAERGLTAIGASELEYYLHSETYREAADRNYQNLTPSRWHIQDYHLMEGGMEERYNGAVRRHLKASGIPVETSKGEWGRGQHEMNIRYSDVLTMADRHSVMKMAMKDIADQQGVSATFMAKPLSTEAGSSCHIHLSLWSGDTNAFAGDTVEGATPTSDLFRWFLAGWMARLPELMVMSAPNINSYKRYQDGSWAPTRLAWSHDNRTAGFRVVGDGASLRIECRVPGADCNPYLAFAAAIAAGLDGIERELEPPEMFAGNVYEAQSIAKIPQPLHEALDLFADSEFAEKAFGKGVRDHYVQFFRTEQSAFDTSVTDWERRRYFERI